MITEMLHLVQGSTLAAALVVLATKQYVMATRTYYVFVVFQCFDTSKMNPIKK